MNNYDYEVEKYLIEIEQNQDLEMLKRYKKQFEINRRS